MATESTRFALKKVTLRYIPVEDRMRMDAMVAEEKEVFTFWLTQRLCRELVTALVKHLSSAGLAKSGATPADIAAVQGYYQQQAKSAKKKTAPVPVATPRSHLVDRVQLRTSAKAIQIVFPVGDGGQAILPFVSHEARQWLEILYRQYRVAGWPLDMWPQWIRDEKATPLQENSRKPLH